jgi:hypothetical protein|tara:strand:+ start:51 stop:287 length:237 start_codon:yes stop_codon:yes gene_type:complete
MACKNCKEKTSKYLKELNKMGTNINFDREARKKQIFEKTWDDSMGKLRGWERAVLILFAWIPLIIGYFTIVKFIIFLF